MEIQEMTKTADAMDEAAANLEDAADQMRAKAGELQDNYHLLNLLHSLSDDLPQLQELVRARVEMIKAEAHQQIEGEEDGDETPPVQPTVEEALALLDKAACDLKAAYYNMGEDVEVCVHIYMFKE